MFSISLDLDEATVAAIGQQAEALVGPACAQGIRLGLDAGVQEAKTNHRYQDRSEDGLTKSIGGRVMSSDSGGAEGIFEATAEHASHVEEGTPPHEILPRSKRALHWNTGSGDVFAGRVEHPGTQAQPFMEPASKVVDEVARREIEIDLTARLQRLLGGT
jgi:hypothetical protein